MAAILIVSLVNIVDHGGAFARFTTSYPVQGSVGSGTWYVNL